MAYVDGADSAKQAPFLFDPQTSGGLLISVDGRDVDRLVNSLTSEGVAQAACIGEVVSEPVEKIVID